MKYGLPEEDHDVVGDLLTLTAWAVGTSRESGQQISVQDSRFQQGGIGISYFDSIEGDLPEPTPATYRFFEAVPEPSAMVLLLPGVAFAMCVLRRHRVTPFGMENSRNKGEVR